MNKKILKLFVIGFLVLNLTGCTTYLKDENKKIIANKETGLNLPKNILCQPTNKNNIKLYENYNKTTTSTKVDLKNLDQCKDLRIVSNNYQGLWTTFFVQPLAFVIVKIGNLVNSYGIALIIATILVRLVAWPLTKKITLQSKNMAKAKPELEKLEKKYKNVTTREAMMEKQQEMMLIYKKYDISMFGGCLFSFIQIPLFFAFYEAISRIPAIFEETFLGFQLGTSPLTAVLHGKYIYLIFIILIVAATYYSLKLGMTPSVNQEQEKQAIKDNFALFYEAHKRQKAGLKNPAYFIF